MLDLPHALGQLFGLPASGWAERWIRALGHALVAIAMADEPDLGVPSTPIRKAASSDRIAWIIRSAPACTPSIRAHARGGRERRSGDRPLRARGRGERLRAAGMGGATGSG